MDTHQAAIWLGLGFTVGAISIAFALLFVALWLAGKEPRTVTGRRTLRATIGMLFSIGCMQLLVTSMFTWPAATILIWALFIPAGMMALVFALLILLPSFKQALRRLDELT